MVLLNGTVRRWYLQSYETGKMEGIFKSAPIEWALGIIGPTLLTR